MNGLTLGFDGEITYSYGMVIVLVMVGLIVLIMLGYPTNHNQSAINANSLDLDEMTSRATRHHTWIQAV